MMHDRVLGIARGEEHREVRQPFLRSARKFGTTQRAGHDDVSEEEIHRHAALDDGERALRVARLQHPVSKFGQQADGGLADGIVVLHHEDRLGAARTGPVLVSVSMSSRAVSRRR